VRSPALRALARAVCVILAGTFVVLVVVQYVRIVQRNLAYVQQVRDVERDVAALQLKRDDQLRQIVRLSDPRGAIPEIHDRLHLVGDGEAIIYLRRHDDPAAAGAAQ
jgi:hypothetical protein